VLYTGSPNTNHPTMELPNETLEASAKPDLNPSELAKISTEIDWKVILELPDLIKGIYDKDQKCKPGHIIVLLDENKRLISEIMKLQTNRFFNINSRFKTNNQVITPNERLIHSSLQKNLIVILSSLGPKSILPCLSNLRLEMERLPMFEGGWKGTLVRKVHAFPSNQTGRNAFTSDAGILSAVHRIPKK
jgi:hypothetical protein